MANPDDYPAPDDGSGNPISYISAIGMPSRDALASLAAKQSITGLYTIAAFDVMAASRRAPDASTHLFTHDFSVMKHIADSVGIQANVANAMQHVLANSRTNIGAVGNIANAGKTPVTDGIAAQHQ